MKAIIMSSVFDKRELEGEVRTSVAKESNMTGGRGRHLQAIHQSAFVLFRPNGPMGASDLIIWANGSF